MEISSFRTLIKLVRIHFKMWDRKCSI
ncbi:unnamed protein product, partial [Vitis vinifera]|uniref:Uncharacterized protein n=1 Tax=Vitis vinifera TaxID=29760 RepID=D7U5P8_VITVI